MTGPQLNGAQRVYGIANVCYTQENLDRANAYLRSRGLDGTKTAVPYLLTGPLPDFNLAPYIRPQKLVNTLLIPVQSIKNPRRIIAFDTRYLGTDDGERSRYSKIKATPPEPIIYGVHRYLNDYPPGTPCVLAEGAIDCESVTYWTGYPCIGYLTALAAPSVIAFLASLTDTILLALDNDAEGLTASNKLFTIAQQSKHTRTLLSAVNYQGGDPNKALASKESIEALKFGLDSALQQIRIARQNPTPDDIFATPAEVVAAVIKPTVSDPFANG